MEETHQLRACAADNRHMRTKNTRTILLALAVVALAGVGAFAIALDSRSDAPGATAQTPVASEHGAQAPTIARTVFVSSSMPAPSAHAQRMSAMLEGGTMPTEPAMAEVVTDSDCTPDEQMISRCRNVVRLEDGSELVLRHPHKMSEVPCMAPGETVRLLPV